MRLMRAFASLIGAVSITFLAGCGAAPSLNAPAAQAGAMQAAGHAELYEVEDLIGIGKVYGEKLRAAGINNLQALQSATIADDQRQSLAKKAQIPYKHVVTWSHHVELMQVDGLTPRHAALLNAVGVSSLALLAAAEPAALADKVGIANSFKPRFVPVTPNQPVIAKWIEAAKTKTIVSDLGTRLGLHPILVKKLAQAGITNAAALEGAVAGRQGRLKVASDSGIPYERILRMAQKINLMKIEGIGLAEYDLLAAVEVTSVGQLATSIVDDLQYQIARANASEPRFVEKTPSKAVVAAWVEAARKIAAAADDAR